MTPNNFKKKYAVAIGLLGLPRKTSVSDQIILQGPPVRKSAFSSFSPLPDPDYDDGSGPREQGPEQQSFQKPVKSESSLSDSFEEV